MNAPSLMQRLEKLGIENPIICANINKIGFRMCGGMQAYDDLITQGRCRLIAMSVFASGALPATGGFGVRLQVSANRVDRIRRFQPYETSRKPSS